MLSSILLSLALSNAVSATNLWVSSYAGTVSTLSLTKTNSSYQLSNASITHDCLSDPSWLTFNCSTRTLYCVGEKLSGENGSLTTFTASKNGSLITGTQSPTMPGGVNAVQYNIPSGQAFLAIAHYGGSGLTTWSLPDSTKPTLQQTLYYRLSKPGADPSRQTAPRPHQVIIDPSGKFLLSPDLGADLVRVYSINTTNGLLAECPSLPVVPGSGPRHAQFRTPSSNAIEKIASGSRSGQTYMNRQTYMNKSEATTVAMYLVTELGNTLTGYNVTYPSGGCLAFDEIEMENTFGNHTIPAGAAAAGIHIAGNSIIVSNRNDTSFPALGPDVNATDSLATFSLNGDNRFRFQRLTSSGGSFPRSFAQNKAEDLIAVALQQSSSVVILARNVTNGAIGEQVAQIGVEGQVTSVVWDE